MEKGELLGWTDKFGSGGRSLKQMRRTLAATMTRDARERGLRSQEYRGIIERGGKIRAMPIPTPRARILTDNL